jgi:hypothetical protein
VYLARRQLPFALAFIFAVVPVVTISWVLMTADDLAAVDMGRFKRFILYGSVVVSLAIQAITVPTGIWLFVRDRAMRTFVNGFALLCGLSILVIPVAGYATFWLALRR